MVPLRLRPFVRAGKALLTRSRKVSLTRPRDIGITPRRKALIARLTAVALAVCLAFLPYGTFVDAKSFKSWLAQGRSGVRARTGPPEYALPNLDEVRRRRPAEPRAPEPLPSSVRSRQNPLVPRNGRRVGDPFPPLSQGTKSDDSASDEQAVSTVGTDRTERAQAGRSTSKNSPVRLHHAKRLVAPPPLPDDQYLQNFFSWALLRSASSSEATYWNDILRAAYANGQGSIVIAAREMGRTLFESSEYAARARSDQDYVYDLYKTYLMREPDSQGWADWTAAVPLYGRDHVRRGFDESSEFINLMGTLTPNGGITSGVSSLLTARTSAENEPGAGVISRAAEWNLPLLGLPGRAGLDLGLTLSYSSLVWTRSGPYLYFDEDNGSPSPGFRLGFPTIQEKYFDAQVGRNVYVMITSAGRVELRQVGSSTTYEAADSSYLQLIEQGNLLVRATDGTQLTYGWFNSREFRCISIKDRNGNFLTVNYNWLGQITNITDTLGRIVTFNYDGNANLLSITQTWNGQTHQWATFSWGTHTMQSSFSGASVVGAPNGTVMPVFTQVGLHDGSYFTFQYTNAAQVSIIRSYKSDNVQRAYTAFDYDAPAGDAPRLLAFRVWAENWTGTYGVPAEVVTQYSVAGDGACVLTAPDGTVFKQYYGTGWQKGLTTQSEVWSGGVRRKWITTAWTQDNTSVNYELNPRVTETNVYDAEGNRRRVVVNYGAYAAYGLPYEILEYAANGVTPLRSRYFDLQPQW